MCGFFQVIQKNRPIDKKRFLKSLDSMKHRGPDAKGYSFIETEQGENSVYMAFGHQRLSILDLDKRSNQPFFDNKNILLFNGEIYNFKELRSEYENSSIEFHANSDTEVIAKAFSQRRFDDISKFNGMWALSFYDKKNNSIFLSRDRYGKKPLFYYQDNSVFCVSSTIKAIKNYIGKELVFSQKYLLNYLIYGDMFPTDEQATHFEDIKQILPSHNGIFDIDRWEMEQKRYFISSPILLDDDFSEKNLVKKLKRSVELRLNSDRPIALLLSGGIDSSLILSILHHYGYHENVHVFMGDTSRSDDYKYAKMCANKLGIKADTIVSDYSSNAFDRFLQICAHHEKSFPFNGNAIAMSQMYEEISAHDIPVVLDGSGGDEVFGGYWERYIPFALRDATKNGDYEWMESIKKNNHKNRVINNFEAYPQNRSVLKKLFNPFLKLSMNQLANAKNLDPLTQKNLDFDKSLYLDTAGGGRLGEWIWHNDRNSMMSSVESRNPFLDFELHSFMYSGYKSKFHQNWNKYELRKVFDKFSPIPTQWRAEKQGFRWDGKHFFYNNKDQIIEVIKKSEVLKEYMHQDLFCNFAKSFPKVFKSSFGKRFLGIAGIEYMMKQE